RITKIFITHLHGDHLFGLPGLLCTLSLQSGPDASKAPVDIYGPLGLRSFLWRSLQLSHSQLLFPYAVHELVPTPDQCPAEEFRDFSGLDRGEALAQGPPGRVLHLDPGEDSYLLVEDEQLVVRAFRLFHRVPSFGFVLEEKPRPGKLNVQKLKDLGVPPGPLYGQLKGGAAVLLENGATVCPREVLEPPLPGRKVCVLGDCSGTPGMAARLAQRCRARRLVLTHFSQRYRPAAPHGHGHGHGQGQGQAELAELKRQAEAVLDGQEVTLAEDFMTIEIPLKK
ncbi:RNZ1 protein, partial [Chloropsis cyanopogon]|nr:RNZ1 protein [Chloropsis cyanopogon]